MTPEQEFIQWLTANKQTLEKYDIWEIAHLAKLNGFENTLVCNLLTHWINERDHHCSYATRENWYVDRELASLNLLQDSWNHLGYYLTTGKGFENELSD